MRVKLSKQTRETIQATLLNFVSSISDDDEVEVEFSNIDDGSTNMIYFSSTKQSKNPVISKTIILKDNTLDVKCGTIPKDNNKNVDKGTTQSDKGV